MKKLLSTTIVVSFILIVLGGTVRNFDAGLACPDWPLCHGKIIPLFDLPIFLEWFHRLIASCVGFLTLGICIAALVAPTYRSVIGMQSVVALILVIIQAVLGGMTVIGLLDPQWVSAHLAVGFLFFSVLLWMRLILQNSTVDFSRKSDRRIFVQILVVATVLVYLQAVLGAWVASNGAGLACPDFPTCQGEWIPQLVGLVKFQWFHRVMAALILVGIGGVFLTSRAMRIDIRVQKWIMIAVLLTILQILLGIGNVLFQLPEFLSIAHLMVATILFALLFIITYKVKHASIS